MRWTEKRKEAKYGYRYLGGTDGFGEGCQKLGQLEDIEDAWGIELIKLVDMIETETYIWYRHTGFMGITEILEGQIEAISKNGELFIKTVFNINQKDFFDFINNHYYAKDYGKTWALTKEELE